MLVYKVQVIAAETIIRQTKAPQHQAFFQAFVPKDLSLPSFSSI